MENKQKHLEFLQNLIERMSNHSFQLKSWAVTVAAAILALTLKEVHNTTLIVSFIPVIMFWILDAFYLYKERLYRSLYEKIRILNESEIDFDMNTDQFLGRKNRWISSMFSKTLVIFYFSLVTSMIIIIILF